MLFKSEKDIRYTEKQNGGSLTKQNYVIHMNDSKEKDVNH